MSTQRNYLDFQRKNGLEESSDNKKWQLANFAIANNIFVGRYKMYLPWKPTNKYYYIDGSVSEPTIKLGLFSENEVQAIEARCTSFLICTNLI